MGERRRTVANLLHVDLDAFYASVEVLDDPSLAGKPVIVGGTGPRGVVAAASYEARRFGIHSALPGARARRLAPPDAVFLAPRMERYVEVSREVMAILDDVTPLVEPLSLDEAFLDVAGAQDPVPMLVEALRARVLGDTGLVISVGGATTKFLAKLASDLAKPDGVLIVEPGTELALLTPLPVGKLWGVGPATHARLERLGITTIGDLASTDEVVLAGALGKARADHLVALAHNRDDREVEPDRAVKSIGHEETFQEDLTVRSDLERRIVRFSERVGTRLRTADLTGRTVQLKVRYADFTTITRSHTRREPTDLGHDIATEARRLLDGVDLRDGIRLLGVSVSGLGREPVQEVLAFDEPSRVSELERTVDDVRERFGKDALVQGTIDGRHPGKGT